MIIYIRIVQIESSFFGERAAIVVTPGRVDNVWCEQVLTMTTTVRQCTATVPTVYIDTLRDEKLDHWRAILISTRVISTHLMPMLFKPRECHSPQHPSLTSTSRRSSGTLTAAKAAPAS